MKEIITIIFTLLLLLSCAKNDYEFGTELSFSVPNEFHSAVKIQEKSEEKYFSTSDENEALMVSYFFQSLETAEESMKMMQNIAKHIKMRFKPVSNLSESVCPLWMLKH